MFHHNKMVKWINITSATENKSEEMMCTYSWTVKYFCWLSFTNAEGGIQGVVANELERDIVVSQFELYSHHSVHFRTNTPEKSIKTPYPFTWSLILHINRWTAASKYSSLNCSLFISFAFRANTLGKRMDTHILQFKVKDYHI